MIYIWLGPTDLLQDNKDYITKQFKMQVIRLHLTINSNYLSIYGSCYIFLWPQLVPISYHSVWNMTGKDKFRQWCYILWSNIILLSYTYVCC